MGGQDYDTAMSFRYSMSKIAETIIGRMPTLKSAGYCRKGIDKGIHVQLGLYSL